MGKKNKTKTKTVQIKIGFWTAVRDVFIHAMNKGQFPLAIIAMVFLLMIFKMPGDAVSNMAFKIFELFEKGCYIGYGLSVVFLVGWGLHAKWQRRMITKEMRRVADERNKYQGKHINGTIESSEDD